jgi:predicted nuclease of predicted toxin-antitoxin system
LKFLLDVFVASRSLESFLTQQGHDVLSAANAYATASDAQLMELAVAEGRILLTADKDFGELVFVRHLPHGPIVRIVELTVDQQVSALAELLRDQAEILNGPVIVTITAGRIRVRRHP